MDDDQAFVGELVFLTENSDLVDYNTWKVETEDGGRNARVELELWTGDRYRITIEELH